MEEKIKKVIEDEINPMLLADGGSVELSEFKDGVVKVKLQGACATCPYSVMTLQNLVEEKLKEKVKEVKKVESVD
jgi:Fe-S cluster biogenesis protein NfuA